MPSSQISRKDVTTLQYSILFTESKGSCHGYDDSASQLRKIRDKLASGHGKPRKKPYTYPKV